ncbi:hypothetical protein BN946_scf184996.g55 [Trametes cinnabarina]|uniref:Uncharacterized protein n=1 Tax=Pycnoporus cinnabarinus TaxID=5643 RepID=A0A060S8K8_PYCCI|nr:hypothetical protein BN946_scf184996.g55 [Trametes cinnabarina]
MEDNAPPALVVHDDHPLALELASLRAAVSRYQAAHATSLKLQRHSLEASQAVEHARALERENARLKEEVAVLRAYPDSTPTQASFQVPELTLALRRLSDKLTAVEETLLVRTKELAEARSEIANAQHEIEAARALAADARAREEEGLARERELSQRLKAAVEEQRMADLVVQEYAALVRKLEGRIKAPGSSASSVELQRSNSDSNAALVNTLAEGKSGLQRLLQEFNGQNERLEAEIAKLHGDNALLYKELEVARLGAEHDRFELAKAVHELDKHRADDNSATKMVSRYMKFSQSSTDKLQEAIDALKARHAATLATLTAEVAHLQRALEHERAESERLRFALDELTEDIAREAYGRRREVSLRLAFLGREEHLAESLRRWIRRARESLERSFGHTGDGDLDAMELREGFSRAVLEADDLLETLNSQPTVEDGEPPSGSIARLILAQDAVSSLTHELQEETVRRLKTERKLAQLDPYDHSDSLHAHHTARLVAQPTPHRACISQADKPPLIIQEESPTDTPSTTSAQGVASAEHPPSVDHSIDEIEIVPSLDFLPKERSSYSSGPVSSEAAAVEEQPLPEVFSVDVVKAPDGHPSPVTDHELKDNSANMAPSSDSGVPITPVTIPPSTATHEDDTLSVPFPMAPQPSHPDSVVHHSPRSPISSRDRPELERHISTTSFSSTTSLEFAPPPQTSILDLGTIDSSALSPLQNTSPEPALATQETPKSSLLDGLAKVKHRYDSVQRSFRDCHLALKELKKTLTQLPSPATGPSSEFHALLRKAVDRLGDFNEDARVELEIRIADEERVASGYEALLSIPGAMSHSDESENVDTEQMLKEIGAFVVGTDRAVAKATQSFTQKLDDLEHDIASIKRTLHQITLSPSEESLSPTAPSARTSTSPSWSSWTPSFLSPPRSSSPAPTFGSVMTSPRLRHSSSFTRPREPSTSDSPTDPLASLGLRIAVPSPVRSPTYAGLSAGPGPGPGGPQRAGPRPRTASGMFMLGLGMRSTSLGTGLGVHPSASASKSSLAGAVSTSPSSSRLAAVSLGKDESSEEEEIGGADSDIE